MRNASAKGFEKKAPTNNNLPNQTEDVTVNPRNPVNTDSKPSCKPPKSLTKKTTSNHFLIM